MSEVPQTFERFDILRVLGKGGMGTVYLARDQRLGRQVALKLLNPDDLANDERRARFLREARSAAAIRHQNVATLYEVDETDDGSPYLVMEYCEGETLSQRMRRRPLDAAEFLSISRQIAAGVAAAHENNIVHRDLKAANIIIEPTGLVKILDFGLAKLLPRESGDPSEKASFESTSGHFFGTLHYLSPEQARGGTSDMRSDLFSIGIVMYQMASGHLPFNADSPLMVLEKIRDAEPEPFVAVDATLPATAIKIIGRLLQKNPVDRYQSARELLEDLEGIETPTVRLTISTTRSLGRTVRRPKLIRLALIIAAFLIGGAVIYLLQSREKPAATNADAPKTPIRSMAVLPLANLAKSEKDDFLSVSLADALVTKLQQVPSLQVRPTSAIVGYRDKKVDAMTASKQLGVDGVLEGHFLAAGELVRVNLQLTDARTGYSVWAETVDGRRDNLLQLIDDVSERTVRGLNDRLGGLQRVTNQSEPRSTNPKAYEEYLKARALFGTFEPEGYAKQIAALRRAIELDPTFAAAYADLATSMSLAEARSLNTEKDALEKAEWYARQAVRLDPNLPEAHLALGRVFVRNPARFRESVREILTALRLKPNDTQALWGAASYFVSLGEVGKAQCVGERLVSVDPGSNEARTRGYWYVNAVEPEGALQAASAALGVDDSKLAGHDIRGLALIILGDINGAAAEQREAERLAPNHYIGKSLAAMISAARGERETAIAQSKTFEADADRNHWAAVRLSMIYAKLGDRDKAISWLRRSAELGHHSWYSLVKHPWMQSLQGDPEFQEIVAKIKADLDDVRGDVVGVYELICR